MADNVRPHLAHNLASSIMWSSLVLLVGAVGLGGALWSNVIPAPNLELRFSTVSLLGYLTRTPECPPRTVCMPPSTEGQQPFFVIWRIDDPATPTQPYGRTATRLVAVRLLR